jgi:hypothetical protein
MLGTAVVSGMLAATARGVFIIPALFVGVERLASGRRRREAGSAEPPEVSATGSRG